ncbi:hypothetical protein [Synechococcus sp. RSCCF101]|uniref:hypothetical protein n=1 Tax=Synechococcus sp. RSCCF101 TaxID=2511069 RepID=UPI001785C826|nr:hypothetical protein [Synechococcus sp. RSCCF101]
MTHPIPRDRVQLLAWLERRGAAVPPQLRRVVALDARLRQGAEDDGDAALG